MPIIIEPDKPFPIEKFKRIKGVLITTFKDTSKTVVDSLYTNKVPNLHLKVGKKTLTLEVDVYSKETDDTRILHKMLHETNTNQVD